MYIGINNAFYSCTFALKYCRSKTRLASASCKLWEKKILQRQIYSIREDVKSRFHKQKKLGICAGC